MADSDLVVGLAEATQHDSPEIEKKLSDSIADDSFDKEVDSIHEGLVFPTDEELLTLRRVSDAIPWAAYRESSNLAFRPTYIHFAVIAFVELAERFSVSSFSYRFSNHEC